MFISSTSSREKEGYTSQNGYVPHKRTNILSIKIYFTLTTILAVAIWDTFQFQQLTQYLHEQVKRLRVGCAIWYAIKMRKMLLDK